MLLDGALFEDGLVWVGVVVADGDVLVVHGADELVGVGLALEFVNVLAGAVLADEVGVVERREKALGLGDGSDGAAGDAAVDRGPALGGILSALLAPAPIVDAGPSGDEGKRVLEQINPSRARSAGYRATWWR